VNAAEKFERAVQQAAEEFDRAGKALVAEWQQKVDAAQDAVEQAVARYDAAKLEADVRRDQALDDAAAARVVAVKSAQQKFDDAMRAELGLSVRLVESGGVLRVVDDKTQVVIASSTPNHAGTHRVNGPGKEPVLVPAEHARQVLWESLRPERVPV
jgi:hypothetical protein